MSLRVIAIAILKSSQHGLIHKEDRIAQKKSAYKSKKDNEDKYGNDKR